MDGTLILQFDADGTPSSPGQTFRAEKIPFAFPGCPESEIPLVTIMLPEGLTTNCIVSAGVTLDEKDEPARFRLRRTGKNGEKSEIEVSPNADGVLTKSTGPGRMLSAGIGARMLVLWDVSDGKKVPLVCAKVIFCNDDDMTPPSLVMVKELFEESHGLKNIFPSSGNGSTWLDLQAILRESGHLTRGAVIWILRLLVLERTVREFKPLFDKIVKSSSGRSGIAKKRRKVDQITKPTISALSVISREPHLNSNMTVNVETRTLSHGVTWSPDISEFLAQLEEEYNELNASRVKLNENAISLSCSRGAYFARIHQTLTELETAWRQGYRQSGVANSVCPSELRHEFEKLRKSFTAPRTSWGGGTSAGWMIELPEQNKVETEADEYEKLYEHWLFLRLMLAFEECGFKNAVDGWQKLQQEGASVPSERVLLNQFNQFVQLEADGVRCYCVCAPCAEKVQKDGSVEADPRISPWPKDLPWKWWAYPTADKKWKTTPDFLLVFESVRDEGVNRYAVVIDAKTAESPDPFSNWQKCRAHYQDNLSVSPTDSDPSKKDKVDESWIFGWMTLKNVEEACNTKDPQVGENVLFYGPRQHSDFKPENDPLCNWLLERICEFRKVMTH